MEPVLELSTSGPAKPPRGSRKSFDELTPQEQEATRRLVAAVAAAIRGVEELLPPLREAGAQLAGVLQDFRPLALDLGERARSVVVGLQRLAAPGTPWGDALLAGNPDRPDGARREAALRLAQFLGWPAGRYTRRLLEWKARDEGRNPAAVRDDVYGAAIQAVLSEPGDLLPVYVEGRALTRPDGRPATVEDLAGDVPFWRWLREEVAWAVEDLLLGRPYSPAVRLEAMPPEDGPLPLVQRASVRLLRPTANGGAPRLEERPDYVQAILSTLDRVYERQRKYGLSLRAAARYEGVAESTVRTWERELQERGIPLPK